MNEYQNITTKYNKKNPYDRNRTFYVYVLILKTFSQIVEFEFEFCQKT